MNGGGPRPCAGHCGTYVYGTDVRCPRCGRPVHDADQPARPPSQAARRASAGGLFRRLFTPAAVPSGGLTPAPGHHADIEIVGEDSCVPAIGRLLARYGRDSFDLELVPDPGNPHDRHAVAVVVDGERVGYLQREMAPHWLPLILAANGEGFAITGAARIFGGTEDKPNLGVFGEATWVGQAAPPRRRDGR